MAQEAYDPENRRGVATHDAPQRGRRGRRRGPGAAPRGRADAAERRWPAHHHHPAAARLRPARRAHHLLHRPRRAHGRARVQRAAGSPTRRSTRLWTGALWSEGPAWSAQGRYLVWSDIPNNRQLRWIEDDGHVSVFRMPSNNSNGNTFDFQGRQLSCEHVTRRVVRYELDGSVSLIADTFNGKRLNSPNDVVPHPDGSYWFTDPPYGAQLYEGDGGRGGRSRPTPAAGSTRSSGSRSSSAPASASCPPRCTASTRAARMTSWSAEDQVPDPNGLCFSPDYKKLYVISTGKGPGDTDAGGKGDMYVFDVGADNKLSNRQALQRLHGRRRQVRARRRARRRRRQPLGLEQRGPRGGLQRRHGVDARRAS